ncbi:amidase [Henriciella barbarensis]|uniref:Amidase n=1 Tax=Henriciella barbarensis TaxID=86342 RepID=A0A399QVJ9_9PROT|nr:amidase family protein [Henriciella barbarensis]RIJ21449.1 amidase [Henriciella barbarensis]
MTNISELGTATALQTADLVRRGEVSALEVCDAAIDRIESRDGPINAVVVRDFERARASARSIDTSRTKEDERPLLGVAMTVKESNDVCGLPTTWGFTEFADYTPEQDAVAVERLKAAGAVILGKTNAPVALADWQTVNPVYGRTVNPHDHARSPGGSSGGAGAALAAGMVPLELGSDIGGSIRIPANFCGVYGHKPTYGVIPLQGHGFPGTDGVDVPLAVVGPLARSAKDLTTALSVMSGSAVPGWKLDMKPPRHRELEEYRVLVLPGDGLPPVADDVATAINEFVKSLDDAGVDIAMHADGLPDFSVAQANYVAMLTAITTRGTPGAEPIDAHAWMDLVDAQMRLQRQWNEVFRDFDIVLAPTASSTAFPHMDEPDWHDRPYTVNGERVNYGVQVFWAGLATYPGLPSTAMPLSTSAEGLPTGLQALGGQFEDLTTLKFAELVEQAGLTLDPAASISR